ncbi:flagellar export protein FliJ [Alkalicoccus chagannorensis]|uniref:flagellar export protein FliJ n=1 Tax=Alkalicoccus chagannorensis TaxID=427072 RepID=UPI00041DDAFA|nr:flagellar export protein FliJ [Alkalicoccus chagannorensis]
MSTPFSLQKILDVKEHEKYLAETAYADSLETFEAKATELYEQLKRKEELEQRNREQIQAGTAIMQIQQTEKTLAFLEKQIEQLELQTKRARRDMTDKERFLQMKSIDVKKYERMKELEAEKTADQEKKDELHFLDDISLQQFVRK